MKLFFLSILVFLSLSIKSIAQEQDDYVSSTVARNNAFALHYYSLMNTNEDNMVLSPFGVSTCMAMAYIGSEDKTQKKIAEEFNFITPYGVLFSFKQLIKRYQIYKSKDINLLIGNALWTNEKSDLQKKYKNLLKINFAAHVQELNFESNDEKNAKVINRWVKKASNFNIRTIIGNDINEENQLIYSNYLYLNGNWENPFNEQFTGKSDFYLADSTKIKVDFMNQTSYLRYNENNIFQILELPYAGRNISMVVLLPKKYQYLDTLERSLNQINFDFWNEELYTKLVSVSLPKFRIEDIQELTSFLKDRNLDNLLSEDHANFNHISKDKVFISKIIQKTVIEVEENENNNFTELVISPEQAEKSIDNTFIRFNANKTFLFVIRDNLNNSILIIGKVIYPNFNNLSAEYYN